MTTKPLSPAKNMPAIATITVRPETSTARPGGRRGPLQRRPRVVTGGPLLALAPHVEERVVDADRQPDQQDDRRDALVDREDWLGSATSPIVASTAESASSSGTPAATSEPNATSEDHQRDRQRQLLGLLEVLVEDAAERLAGAASPNSSIRRSGCAR